MDELLAKHRKELRDLQSIITSKKKSATKKTRKGVNAECEQLEQDMKARHEREIAELNGERVDNEEDVVVEEPKEAGDEDTLNREEGAVEDRMAGLSVSEHQKQAADQPRRKPNRQKARLARRAAEQLALAEAAEKEAANQPNQREQEQKALQARFSELGMVEQDIPPDGHCLYSAFADQLKVLGKSIPEEEPGYKIMRKACAEFLREHRDDFEPFLEEDFDEHLQKVAETAEWGGQLEVQALARAYEVTANIVQAQGRIERLNEGKAEEVWLAYHRHNFGLGEHYNSLRKKH